MIFFVIFVVALATYFDLKYRKIPNWLTYPALVVALFKFDSFFIFIIIAAILVSMIFGEYIGAGDIKLAMVIAIWSHLLSWSQMWIYFALLLGGLFGLLYRRRSLPFAPFMASGVLVANLAQSIHIL